MIIVYGGCQADEPVRYPQAALGAAAEDLSRPDPWPAPVIGAEGLVGALASGADILFARAALAEGIRAGGTASLRRRDIPQDKRGAGGRTLDRRLRPDHLHRDVKVDDAGLDPADADVYRKHNSPCSIRQKPWHVREQRRSGSSAVRPQPDPLSPSATDDLVRAEERRC